MRRNKVGKAVAASARVESEPAVGRIRERIHWIDVFRGLAVLLLFAIHSLILVSDTTPPWLVAAAYRILYVCIPMFMCVSGMTMWYLLAGRQGDTKRTVRRYAVRGVWLLVWCHVLITLGTWPLTWDKESFLDVLLLRWHITDAIAACLWLGPWLIFRLDDRRRLALALVLLVGSRLLATFWHPAIGGMGFAQEFLFGQNDYAKTTALLNVYPVGPYLAMFLLGTVLFPFVQRRIQEGGVGKAVRFLVVLCLALMVMGAAAVAVYVGLRRALDAKEYADLLAFFYPTKTSALLPLYLAATGLLLAVVLWWNLSQRRYTKLDFVLTVWGRTALFAFVVQYFVIQAIPTLLGWRGEVPIILCGPLVLVFCAILFLVSYAYARVRGYVAAGEYDAIRASLADSPAASPPAARKAGPPRAEASLGVTDSRVS